MKKQIHFGNKSCKSNLDFNKLNELQERLQGTSENSNPVTDPFKFLGEFDSYDKLNATLDTLTYSLGYQKGYGYFRARVGDRAIEVKSILMSSGLNVVGQVVQGMLSLDGKKKLSSADSTYRIYFRKHQNNVWGEWKEITGTTSSGGSVDLLDYVKGIKLSPELVLTPEDNIIDLQGVFAESSTLSNYVKKTELATINGKSLLEGGNITITGSGEAIDTSKFATEEYVDTEVTALWDTVDQKQDTLVSGTNIKTINNQSILGSGNIVISGSGEAIDTSKFATKEDLKSKQATLVSGTNIKTINNQSILGDGNITITGSGSADPFKYIYADDYDDLNEKLDNLTPSEDNIGFFLAKINNKTIEIQHILLRTDFYHSLQIVKGAIKIDEKDNLRLAYGEEYRVLCRKFDIVNFNAWEEYAGTSSGDIDINTYLKIEEAAETYATKKEVETMRFYPLVNHGASDTTFTLTPNVFHVWGTVTSLTLTLGSETSGVANEYLFQFSCTSSAVTTLGLPAGIQWANGETPSLEIMKTYQVSILNNCATIQSFG